MSTDSLNSGRRRRTYTPQFKADMVAHCLQGDVSLASLAVDHGMNPNVLHRWVLEHERYGKHSLGVMQPRAMDVLESGINSYAGEQAQTSLLALQPSRAARAR